MASPETACTIAAFASPIEMAFAANLFIAAWATVRSSLDAQQRTLTSAADALAEDEWIQEELSIKRLRATIHAWDRWGSVLWWFGVASGVLSAACLYILQWHFPDLAVCGQPWRWPLLMAAAYTSPASMLLMVLVRKWGHRKASKQKVELEQIAEDKRTRGDEKLNEVRKLIDSILERLPTQPPRNPDNNAR